MAPERSEATTEADLAENAIVHRYLQIEEGGGFQDVDSETDWFTLGDQESWIEPRLRQPMEPRMPESDQ